MLDLHLDTHRQVIRGDRLLVRSDNVKQVEKVADEANTKELRKYCEEYIIENTEAVLLLCIECRRIAAAAQPNETFFEVISRGMHISGVVARNTMPFAFSAALLCSRRSSDICAL